MAEQKSESGAARICRLLERTGKLGVDVGEGFYPCPKQPIETGLPGLEDCPALLAAHDRFEFANKNGDLGGSGIAA
jgi:hypothetical protein